MNQFEENSLRRYNAMKQVLNDHSTVWNANATTTQAVTDFLNKLDELNNLGGQQLNTTKGVTNTKQNAREDLVDATMRHVSACKAYATNNNDLELYTTCKISRRKLLLARGEDMRALAQRLYNTISPEIANLGDYGADATSLLDWQNALTLFGSLLGAPRAEQAKKVASTKMLKRAFEDMRSIKDDRLSPLIMQYKSSNAAFYNSYVSSCAIANLGHRHKVAFRGGVYDANQQPIKHAGIVLTGPKKRKKITEANGQYKFTQLTPGVYTFTVSLLNGQVQSKTITVDEPKLVVIDFLF